MKQNDEHQDEGQKNVGVSPLCLGRAMVTSFLSTSGRLRQPSLAPNVLYVIRKYMRRYLGSIAIIRGSVLPFTDIEWLPCEGFLALLAVLLPLIYTV